MRFKIDENLPGEVVDLLNNTGHDAVSVLEQKLGGKSDAVIADICQKENRVLLTLDTDFAYLRTYSPHTFHGIIALRLKRHNTTYILSVLKRLQPILLSEPLEQHLWIVDEQRVRIRGVE